MGRRVLRSPAAVTRCGSDAGDAVAARCEAVDGVRGNGERWRRWLQSVPYSFQIQLYHCTTVHKVRVSDAEYVLGGVLRVMKYSNALMYYGWERERHASGIRHDAYLLHYRRILFTMGCFLV